MNQVHIEQEPPQQEQEGEHTRVNKRELAMESTESWSECQGPHLPPGFRFHPTDEELVVHYLKKKAASAPLPVTIIAEVDLYKFDPWELPGKASFGEQEWYFFSPRNRKYPNGARPNRAATSGYWKATGTDKPILTSGGTQKVGVKKALVFYGGRPPKGIKTNWIMHEYRLADDNASKSPNFSYSSKKNSLRLDDWVLCRIYKKNCSQRLAQPERDSSIDDILAPIPSLMKGRLMSETESKKISNSRALIDGGDHFFEGLLPSDGISGNPMLQLPSSSSNTRPDLAAAPPPSVLPPKRTLNSPYWTAAALSGPPLKRFSGGSDSDVASGASSNSTNSLMELLNQLPQPDAYHQNTLLSCFGDGILHQQYQFSGMNYNS